MTTLTVPREEAGALVDRIQEHVLLVSLTIRCPTFSSQIPRAKVGLDTEDGEQSLSQQFHKPPTWSLFNAWIRRFKHVESAARRSLSSRSVPFSGKSGQLLPIAAAAETFRELREHREAYHSLTDEFVAQYAAELTRLQAEMGPALYKAASASLPAPHKIHDRFGMRWAILELAGGRHKQMLLEARRVMRGYLDANKSLPVREMTALCQQIGEAIIRSADEELTAEARQEMQRMLAESVEAMSREPRRELEAAVRNLVEALSSGRTIQNVSLDRVRRAFSKLRSFSFLADNDLMRAIGEADVMLNSAEARDVNRNESLGQQLAARLAEVGRQASNEAAAGAAARRFRRIHIRDESELA